MAGFVLKRWIILAVLSAISMMCHAADSVSTEIKPWPAAPFKLLTSGVETLTASRAISRGNLPVFCSIIAR